MGRVKCFLFALGSVNLRRKLDNNLRRVLIAVVIWTLITRVTYRVDYYIRKCYEPKNIGLGVINCMYNITGIASGCCWLNYRPLDNALRLLPVSFMDR